MKQLIKVTSILSLVSVGEMFSRVFRTKCMALFLGTSGTGFLAQLFMLFETIRMCTTFGSRRAVVRQIARAKLDGMESPGYRRAVSSSFFLVLTVSSAVSLLVVVFSKWIAAAIYAEASYYPYVIAVACIIPVASAATLLSSIFKGNLAYSSFAKYTLASYAVIIVLTPGAIYFFHYWGAVFVQLLLFACPVASYLILNARRPFLYFSRAIDGGMLREQFSDGFNFLYQEFLGSLARLYVATWITKGLGLPAMGIYQVVITFTTVYLMIPIQSVAGYTVPMIAQADDNEHIIKAVNDSLRLLLFMLAPIIASLFIWPEIFITVLYSSDFLGAAPVLRIQLFGALISLGAHSLGAALAARGKFKSLYAVSTVYAAVYLGLCWALFPHWQLKGVAWAFTLATAVMVAMIYGMLKRYFHMRIYPQNIRLLGWTALWFLLAGAGQAFDGWGVKIVLIALAAPWFLVSLQTSERKAIIDKVRSAVS